MRKDGEERREEQIKQKDEKKWVGVESNGTKGCRGERIKRERKKGGERREEKRVDIGEEKEGRVKVTKVERWEKGEKHEIEWKK